MFIVQRWSNRGHDLEMKLLWPVGLMFVDNYCWSTALIDPPSVVYILNCFSVWCADLQNAELFILRNLHYLQCNNAWLHSILIIARPVSMHCTTSPLWINEYQNIRFYRLFVVDFSVFSVCQIPTSVLVSICQNIRYQFGFSVYRPMTNIKARHGTRRLPSSMPYNTRIIHRLLLSPTRRYCSCNDDNRPIETAIITDISDDCWRHTADDVCI